jgi:predicted lactoylglutathione lyase
MTKRRQIVLLAAVMLVCGVSYSLSQDTTEAERKMEPRISLITLGVSNLERSFRFYSEGLGLPTKMTPDRGIIVYATSGTRLALYSYEKLAEDVGLKLSEGEKKKPAFSGVTLGHCARNKEEVDRLLALAEKSGGKIVKPARTASWGGYSGYFSDPDGHFFWEVAYSDQWKFNPDGSIAME